GRPVEMIEAVNELQGAARDIGARLIVDFDRRIGTDGVARPRNRLSRDQHLAANDRIAGARARRIEPTLDQGFIEAETGHAGMMPRMSMEVRRWRASTIARSGYFTSRSSVPAGVPSGLRVIFSMRASASFRRRLQCFL